MTPEERSLLDRLDERVKVLQRDVKHLDSLLTLMEAKVAALHKMAAQAKGGFLLTLALGGFVGWLTTTVGKFTSLWH